MIAQNACEFNYGLPSALLKAAPLAQLVLRAQAIAVPYLCSYYHSCATAVP
jgi:hypothetical protein